MRLIYDQRCVGCSEWLEHGEEVELLSNGDVRCDLCAHRFAEELDPDDAFLDGWLEGDH